MFKPTSEHHIFKAVYVKLFEEFGWSKADQIYRWAQYYTYRDDRDFWNVLNEHPDVIKFVQEKREGQLLGNVWGVPYPEPHYRCPICGSEDRVEHNDEMHAQEGRW